MNTQKKRPAAATAERKTTTRVAAQGAFSISQAVKIFKRFLFLLGSVLAALAAFLFFFAPVDPGEMSWSAGLALTLTAGWTARMMYQLAE